MLGDTTPMGKALLGSMIIWAAVILAVAVVSPAEMGPILTILGGGAAGHLVILGGLTRQRDGPR